MPTAHYELALRSCAMHTGSDKDRTCQMSESVDFTMPRLLAAVIGGFLFWNAPALSTSTPFRWDWDAGS